MLSISHIENIYENYSQIRLWTRAMISLVEKPYDTVNVVFRVLLLKKGRVRITAGFLKATVDIPTYVRSQY